MNVDLTHAELEFLRAMMKSQPSGSEWRKNPIFTTVIEKVTLAAVALETKEKIEKWLEH